MPSWLKKIVSLGRRPKGSTSVTKQDQSNSRSDFKSTAPSKGSCSNGQKSTPESQPDERVGERKRTQPQGKLPRNTTKNSEEQPRDSVNMTAAAAAAAAAAATTAVSPTQKTSTSVSDHVHLSQRTGDLIQTSAHNGVGDIENSGSALNPNQIVFVLKSGNGGYRIYSLIEEEPSSAAAAAAAAAAAKSSDESASENGEKIKKAKVINGKAGHDHMKMRKLSPFKLSVTYAQSLPEELTREFLVEKVPEHLAGVDELHVIVSTRSGLGLAAGFYAGVLKPLLEEGFGFEAIGDMVEGDDDDKGGRKTRSGKTYQITFTQSADTVKDFARGLVSPSSPSSSAQGRQQRQPSRTIILLSGDGGIIDLLNGLDHHQLDVSSSPSSIPTPTLAILPLGTGNALFHSLHKPLYKPQGTDGPSPLVLGLRTLFKRGVSAPLPTFRAEFSPGAKLISGQPEVLPDSNDIQPKDNLLFDTTNSATPIRKRPEITHLLGTIVFSYGFHASLVYESDTPAYRVHGDKRFGMAAGELLKLSHLYNAEVFIRRRSSSSSSSEQEEITTLLPKDSHSTYILLTLVSNLEKTFCISPASRPLDGQLRLVHFGFGEEEGAAGGAEAEAEAAAENRGKQTMDIMMAAYRDGAHINDPEEKFKDVVGYQEVEEIKVVINETDERWRKVCVDGTIVEVEKGGWVTVKRERGIGSGTGEKGRERLRVLVDKGVVVGR
ncbi:hypothetical protein QR685DRAFT_495157 [Neurospora intermedia]|uniref:DAGKc domain-containing protein n=1 Tax=Neurospora intermedia TaxID=5142 RepID=A0ABR3DHM5_NEUIN